MKYMVIKSLLVSVITLFAIQKAEAYCIYYNNADPQLRSKDTPVLKVWVFKSKDDWSGLKIAEDIRKKVVDLVKQLEPAAKARAEAKAAGEAAAKEAAPAVQATEEGSVATAAAGEKPTITPEAVIGVVVKLTTPLSDLIGKIHEKAVIKAIHTFGPTEASACWNWAEIQKALGLRKNIYAVVFDQSNNSYLGEFEFDPRGYVRLQVIKDEQGNPQLAVARIDYDPNAKDPKYPYTLRDVQPAGAQMLHTF